MRKSLARAMLVGLLLGGWLAAPTYAQPFSAQIQRALALFKATANTFTLAQTITRAAIGVTSTAGLTLSNTTPAALGAQQQSPALQLSGFGWGTTAGTSQAVDCRWEMLPTQALVPGSDTFYKCSVGGAAYVSQLLIRGTNTGLTTLFVGAGVGLGSGLLADSTGYLGFSSRSRYYSTANGLHDLVQSSGTLLGVQVNSGTTVPTVANCSVGTTGVVSTHSTNTAGSAVPGSGSTACDIVFGTPAFAFAPFCVITDYTSVILAPKISVRATTGFTVTGLTAGDTFGWICLGGTF